MGCRALALPAQRASHLYAPPAVPSRDPAPVPLSRWCLAEGCLISASRDEVHPVTEPVATPFADDVPASCRIVAIGDFFSGPGTRHTQRFISGSILDSICYFLCSYL